MHLCNFTLHPLLCKKRDGKYIHLLGSFKCIYLAGQSYNFAKITESNILFISLGNESKMQTDPVADIPRKQTNDKCFISSSHRRKTNKKTNSQFILRAALSSGNTSQHWRFTTYISSCFCCYWTLQFYSSHLWKHILGTLLPWEYFLVLEVCFLAGAQYFLLSDILLSAKLLILMFPKQSTK